MEQLQHKLGVVFRDLRLLESAFVHRSFANEHPERIVGLSSNERLEFLGDAVLNFLSAAWLFERFPTHSEGELTGLRAALVKTATLARFARAFELGRYIRISKGEDTPATRDRDSLLADLFEALLGALFLDGGLDAVRGFILPLLAEESAAILAGQRAESDYRTRLQERVQSEHGLTPTYHLAETSGPEHQREFTMAVLVGEQQIGLGKGPSKQAAAQAAARNALSSIEGETGSRGAGRQGDGERFEG